SKRAGRLEFTRASVKDLAQIGAAAAGRLYSLGRGRSTVLALEGLRQDLPPPGEDLFDIPADQQPGDQRLQRAAGGQVVHVIAHFRAAGDFLEAVLVAPEAVRALH